MLVGGFPCSGLGAVGRGHINIVIPMLWKNLREEIDATLARDPAARSRLEVVLCYPGFHALVCHRLAHRLWRRGWLIAGRFASHLGRMLTGIEIHPGRPHRPASVHRPRHGRGDRRDRGNRRRLHALPGCHPRRHLADAAAKSDIRPSATALSSAPARRFWGRSASATAPVSGRPRWYCARCPTAPRWSATRRAKSPAATPPRSRGRPSSPTPFAATSQTRSPAR